MIPCIFPFFLYNITRCSDSLLYDHTVHNTWSTPPTSNITLPAPHPLPPGQRVQGPAPVGRPAPDLQAGPPAGDPAPALRSVGPGHQAPLPGGVEDPGPALGLHQRPHAGHRAAVDRSVTFLFGCIVLFCIVYYYYTSCLLPGCVLGSGRFAHNINIIGYINT